MSGDRIKGHMLDIWKSKGEDKTGGLTELMES